MQYSESIYIPHTDLHVCDRPQLQSDQCECRIYYYNVSYSYLLTNHFSDHEDKGDEASSDELNLCLACNFIHDFHMTIAVGSSMEVRGVGMMTEPPFGI